MLTANEELRLAEHERMAAVHAEEYAESGREVARLLMELHSDIVAQLRAKEGRDGQDRKD